ncbi:MAG: LysR family transcriptional regulator [Rubricella sp.]
MTRLNLRHLGYFRAVAHEGNLTRAAERMNLSQSALSVQLKALEASIGHDLFERRGRGLVLTEAGRIALDYADSIHAAGEELVSTLAGQGGPTRRPLRVGATATLSRNFQIGFLRPMAQRDDVELVLRSGTMAELLTGLEALNLDLVLTNQPPAQDAGSPWVSGMIEEQPVSVVGPPGTGRLDPPKGLEGRAILLPSRASAIRTGFDALMEAAGITPRIAAEVDDMAMLRLLARESGVLALVPPVVVRDELDQGLLQEVAALPTLREQFWAVTLPRRFPNPLVAELLDRG